MSEEKKRILVVDDERATTLLLKARFEKTGRYEVRAENSGEQGLAAAREFRPDLVLLDVMMPDLDGGQVAACMKEDESLKDIRIVFLTAAVTKEELPAQGSTIGGYPFIAKPVDPQLVIEFVDRQLR